MVVKKVNSIGYGHWFLLAIGVLGVGVPGVCVLLSLVVGTLPTLTLVRNASLVMGGVVGLLFAGLLAVELTQDRAADRRDARRRTLRRCPACDRPATWVVGEVCEQCEAGRVARSLNNPACGEPM